MSIEYEGQSDSDSSSDELDTTIEMLNKGTNNLINIDLKYYSC